jgi:hypothetical protein
LGKTEPSQAIESVFNRTFLFLHEGFFIKES